MGPSCTVYEWIPCFPDWGKSAFGKASRDSRYSSKKVSSIEDGSKAVSGFGTSPNRSGSSFVQPRVKE